MCKAQMNAGEHVFRRWTADLERKLAKLDSASLHGIILRNQIEFNRAVLQLQNERRGRRRR